LTNIANIPHPNILIIQSITEQIITFGLGTMLFQVHHYKIMMLNTTIAHIGDAESIIERNENLL